VAAATGIVVARVGRWICDFFVLLFVRVGGFAFFALSGGFFRVAFDADFEPRVLARPFAWVFLAFVVFLAFRVVRRAVFCFAGLCLMRRLVAALTFLRRVVGFFLVIRLAFIFFFFFAAKVGPPSEKLCNTSQLTLNGRTVNISTPMSMSLI